MAEDKKDKVDWLWVFKALWAIFKDFISKANKRQGY
jgi:hypothetical protein